MKPNLTAAQILSVERRSDMTDDEALRFGRVIESMTRSSAVSVMAADLREGQIVVEHERRKVALHIGVYANGSLAVTFAALGPWAGDRLTREYLMPDSRLEAES